MKQATSELITVKDALASFNMNRDTLYSLLDEGGACTTEHPDGVYFLIVGKNGTGERPRRMIVHKNFVRFLQRNTQRLSTHLGDEVSCADYVRGG